MAVLKDHIYQISQHQKNQSLPNFTINLNTKNCNTSSMNTQWSENTSVWSTLHDTPPPPYSDTDYTPDDEPPPSYDSTQCQSSQSSTRFSHSVHRRRRHKRSFTRSINNLSMCSPDFSDLSSDYYFVSPLNVQVAQEESLSATNCTDNMHKLYKSRSEIWHDYVNLCEPKPRRKRLDFSPSFNQTSSTNSDNCVFDCVRQLVFDLTNFIDLTAVENSSVNHGTTLQKNILCSTSQTKKSTIVKHNVSHSSTSQRKNPAKIKHNVSDASNTKHQNKNQEQNQSINSDCTEFYKTSMNRPAVTHNVKVDRLTTVAKQMKQLRKKLVKHGSMQKINMDTLAIL